ncbi:MAG: flavin reductase family protein [Acidimicrobiales bacterium]|jgi:flavin reductase (DIM6/NTAB) family NADH-FMN oxidoreductase RutF
MSEVEAIDPKHFRNVMGQVPTCVTIVTAMVDDAPVAMVIGSFVSVSLDPPLAGFFCTTESGTWQELRGADVLGVNVLGADQIDVSNACMRAPEERFEGLDWSVVDGAPKIAGTTAWLTLTPNQVIDAGDHEFALCNVTHIEASAEPSEPVIFFGGGYRTLAPKE